MFMFVLGNRLTVGDIFFSCIMSCVGSPHFTASVGTVNEIIGGKRKRVRDGHVGRMYLNCGCDTVYTYTAVIIIRPPLAPRLITLPYLCHSPAAYFALPLPSVHLTREMLNEF